MRSLVLALAVVACGSDRPARPTTAIAIIASWPGASGGELEAGVATILENAVGQVDGVTGMVTSIEDDQVTIVAEVARGRAALPMSFAVREVVSGVQQALPDGVFSPTITTVALAPPAVELAIESERSRSETSELVDEVVVHALVQLVGVNEVKRHGFVQPAVIVRPDLERMTAYGMTAGELVAALRAQHTSLPGGRIDTDTQQQTLRVTGRVSSLAELEELVVTQPRGASVRLRDLATVEVGVEREPEAGELRLTIAAHPEASRREVRERVLGALRELALPPGVKVREVQTATSARKVLAGSIRGHEHAELRRQAELVLHELAAMGITDVVRDPPVDDKPELRVDIDRARAVDLGFQVRDIATAIEVAIGGARAGELSEGTRRRPILVRAPTPDHPFEVLARVVVRGVRGDVVPLSHLVTATYAEQLTLRRRDRERALDLLAPAASAAKVRAYLEQRGKWPEGYRAVIAR